jgi:integrase/recombinase XerD
MKMIFKNPRIFQRMHDGPLGSCIESYAAEMREQGYCAGAMESQIRLVADFSRWMIKTQISPQKLTAECCRTYLRCRARRLRPKRDDRAALNRLLNLLLRQRIIVEPSLPAATPVNEVQTEFGRYLCRERGLVSTTVNCYGSFAGEFLADRFGTGPVDLSLLRPTDVTGFVRRRATSIKSKRVQLMTTALRSFLSWARYCGDVSIDLAACVPSVANWSLSTVPRALPRAQCERVLTSCNRKTAVGRRDYAILLLLARLGLRASEVVSLTLGDLDWQAGVITVRGKGGRHCKLPLPRDVGEAIADYLRNARPPVTHRNVFLRGRAPITSFHGSQAIAYVVRQGLARAGIDSPRKGAHQFRHTLASEMLRQGASLSEIGELLRHRSPQTTTIYAKVDLVSLRALALPWPESAR